MKKSKLKEIGAKEGFSRVIMDSRDASQDYFLNTARAKAMYNQGKLDICGTNSTNAIVYCKNSFGKVQ